MGMFKFTKGILEGTPIDIYNHGDRSRDFTYIEDLAEGIRHLNYIGMQPGDVLVTWADASLLKGLTERLPSTSIKTGVKSFVAWCLD